MADLTMYNMGHGDCFLINDENKEGLLIDCGGSRYSSSIVSTFVSPDLLRIDNKSLMITHFHRDHVNRIKNLDKNIKFKHVYVPNAISSTDIHRAFAIIKYAKPRSATYIMAYNYLTLIPTIENYLYDGSFIHYVSRFSIITFSFAKFTVLWPIKINDGDVTTLPFTALEIELIEKYLSVFSEMKQDEYGSVLEFKTNLNIDRNIRKIIKEFKDQDKDIQSDGMIKIEMISQKLGNQLSLVIKDDEKSLFLGDITHSIYDAEIASYVRPFVGFLKTSHHGSKSHYTSNFPNADTAFITEISSSKTIDYANYNFSRYKNLIVCDPDLGLPGIQYLGNFIKLSY